MPTPLFEKGRVKTGGRAKGTLNKSGAEIKEYAQRYSTKAIDKLATLAGLKGPQGKAESEQTQAYCCNLILDRAHGKPAQPIAQDEDNPFELIARHLDGLTRGVPSQYRRPPPLLEGKAIQQVEDGQT